jgi:ABC-type nickel/cobalt efflux system permease component RcnA
MVALGLSGGLVPSPTVFLILVTGLLTGRTAFAVVLVLLFGIGMAVTLTLVGAVTIRGVQLAGRVSRSSVALERAHALLPVAAAWTVLVLGGVYVGLAVLALR